MSEILEFAEVMRITPSRLRVVKSLLDRKSPATDAGSDEVLMSFTHRFPDGFEVDLKVCNGDTPWLDAVLFDPHGHEVQVLEPSDTILGEYPFDGHKLTVVLA